MNPFEEYVNNLEPIDPTEPPRPHPFVRSVFLPGAQTEPLTPADFIEASSEFRRRAYWRAVEESREQIERLFRDALDRLLNEDDES